MPPRTPRKRSIEDPKSVEKADSPYKLRENSKLPSRYRETDQLPQSPLRRTPKSTKNSPKFIPKQGRYANSPKKDIKLDSEDEPTSSYRRMSNSGPYRAARRTLALDDVRPSSEVRSTPENSNLDFESIFEPDMFESQESRQVMLSKMSRYKTKNEIGQIMRTNLKRLKNILTLPKARQWVISEFFYSGVDEQLFLSQTEFRNIIQEFYPLLQVEEMTLAEWRVVRRRFGKPRRCSQTFLDEERECLEGRRNKVRTIYEGSYLQDRGFDINDLPNKLPKPLIIGMRVYARIRTPKDGIYAGSIDAVLSGAYRIIFEKKELPPAVVIDTEVMLDGRQELIDICYFVEQVNARLPPGIHPNLRPIKGSEEKPTVIRSELSTDTTEQALLDESTENFPGSDMEVVGNFPLRFLILVAKSHKLVNVKKRLVRQLTEMNAEAERIHLTTFGFSKEFRKRYAEIVGELDIVNQLLQFYLKAVQAYNLQLLIASPDAHKPETVVRMCNLQAARFVQNCNNGLDVVNPKALNLITGLTSLLLQVRAIGQKMSAVDLQSLQESIEKVKSQVSVENQMYFEDFVEVHMKHLHNMMIDSAKAVSAKRRAAQQLKSVKQES